MTTTQATQEFNAFDYVKSCILKQYVKNLLNGSSTTEFSFDMKAFYKNNFVFGYLNKAKALKFVSVQTEESVDESGRLINTYKVSIKDFDIDAKAVSKEGKDYRIFDARLLGLALIRAKK